MNNLRRGPGWYEQWIAGPAAEVRRREVAKELEQSIQSGHYDSETFEEFIQLVNHERLCVELQDTPEGPEKYRTALSENWTIQTIERVSDCLVRTDSRSSHYERELQSRLILSLLALLRAQGVSALHTNLYSTLHSHFEERYRDLQWNPQTASTFTRERFRRVQCSYLLCAGAEYSRHFRQAQPLLALTLSRVASLFFSILSIASIPMVSLISK